jgi:type II secretory pathway pseudopilin PulG
VRRRLATEGGFGVVELLIAMTVMVVAVMALVAVLNSGMVTLRRAAAASTAGAVADQQMEAYRALPNCAIHLDPTTIPGSPQYVGDPAWSGTQRTTTAPLFGSICTVTSAATPTRLKDAQQPITGADGRSYNVDTYIVAVTTPGAAKKVTLVVRNSDSTKTLIRETSTFTPPTGCNNGTHGPVSVGC